jgi:tight adherence protein B
MKAKVDLRHVAEVLSMSLTTHRNAVIGVVFVAVGISVFFSAHSPRGMLRRLAGNHIAGIDAQQRAMYLRRTGETIAWIQLGTIVTALILYGAKPLPLFLAVATLAAGGPGLYFQNKLSTRRRKIDLQANGFALALASALKSTASIGDALRGACDITSQPLKDEVSTSLQQMRVGSTLEEALLALSARSQSMALDIVVATLLTGRQTGGDLPRILEGTASSLRELKRLEEMTDKAMMTSKWAVYIAVVTVVGIVVTMEKMLPGFFEPLRTTAKGQIVAGQLALAFVFALYLAFRFTRKSV